MFFYLQIDSDPTANKKAFNIFHNSEAVDPASGKMIHSVSVVIYELWKLLTIGVTKQLTIARKACLSSVFGLLQPNIDQLVLSLSVLYWSLWAFWHFHSALKDCFSTLCSSWQGFVGWGDQQRVGGVASPQSSLLSSQIKITVISPEAGLSCHCVKETVIWLVMTQPESHYIFDGRLKQKSISVYLRWGSLRGRGLGKSNLLLSLLW